MSEITYMEKDGILYPNITLSENEQDSQPLSKYGSLMKKHLQENDPVKYQSLTLDGKLMEHLHKIDELAKDRHMALMADFQANTPRPPQEDTMANIQWQNQIQMKTEEIVINEMFNQV